MQCFLLFFTFLSVSVMSVFSSMAILPRNDKFLEGRTDQCYYDGISSLGSGYMQNGEVKQTPNACMVMICLKNESILFVGCGTVICKDDESMISNDVSKAYPLCCPRCTKKN